MVLTEKERKALEIQEFRYSIIAEMVNPYLQWAWSEASFLLGHAAWGRSSS